MTAGSLGLNGTITIQNLEYNTASAGYERLNWLNALDLDGDGVSDVKYVTFPDPACRHGTQGTADRRNRPKSGSPKRERGCGHPAAPFHRRSEPV